MNILYIISDDILVNTSANIRNVSLIYGLTTLGHHVEILCLKNTKKQDEDFRKILSKCKIVYLNSIGKTESKDDKGVKLNKNGFRNRIKRIIVTLYNIVRIYDPAYHTVKTVKIQSNIISNPDLIISSSDPRSGHVLADRIIKYINYKGKYIQYWGDPMMNDINASTLVKPLLRYIEKKILDRAQYIIYTNNKIVPYIQNEYKIGNRIFSIPTSNAMLVNRIKSDRCRNEINHNIINVGYFGGYFHKTRNMKPLFDAVLANPNIHLTLAGSTDWVVPDTDRITKYPSLPVDQVNKLQDEMDILIVMENQPRNIKNGICYQIPGKVYHYGLSYNKVMIIMETGITEEEFKDLNRYFFCKNEADEISKTLLNLYACNDPQMSLPVKSFYPAEVAKSLLSNIGVE